MLAVYRSQTRLPNLFGYLTGAPGKKVPVSYSELSTVYRFLNSFHSALAPNFELS